MRGHFAVLGLPESANEREVRAAFVKRAKELHPDLNRSMPVEQAQARFIELKAAYDCLVDAQQRRLYIQELRREQFEHVTEPLKRPKWARKRSRWPKHRSEADVCGDRTSPIDLSGAMTVWEHGKWEQFIRELDSALAKAYWGPVFEGGVHEYPDAFEAEERSDLDHKHVLQLVSGRQLLGHVQTCTFTPLPSATLAYLFGKQYDEHAAKQQLSARQNAILHEAQRHAHHSNQSSGTSWSGMGGTFDFKQAAGAFTNAFKLDESEDDEVVDEMLELHWQGNIAARGQRRLSRKHRDWQAIQFEVLQDNNWVVACHLARMQSAMGRNRYVLLDNNMQETHRVVVWWTPGVHHAHIFNKEGFCETKLSKARLPSSKYWLFEPREVSHNVGGWYFERHPLAHRAESALHPSVSMLWAAFRTLDHQHTKLQPIATRARNWLGVAKKVVIK